MFYKVFLPKTVRTILRRVMGRHAFSLFHPIPYRFSRRDAHRVSDVVFSGHLTHDQGGEIQALEREFAQTVGARFAVATNSGTSALQIACRTLGLRPGDEVIVPAYTFVATAQAVLLSGGVPVFADIDDTFTISPASMRKHITKRTRAIIVVHMFGNVADMDAVMKLARQYNLPVIEDCAQAIGARWRTNDVGTVGHIGCFSFNIKKAIPTGQGGILITNDAHAYRSARAIRNTGIEHEDHAPDVVSVGGTYHMTEMEAVLGRSALRQLEHLNAVRRRNAAHLSSLLAPYRRYLRPYRVLHEAAPSYSRLAFSVNFSALHMTRDQFLSALCERGIPAKVFYPTPLYRYSLFQKRKDLLTGSTFPFAENSGVRYDSVYLPHAEAFSKKQVAMEWSPYWTYRDVKYIAQCISNLIGQHISRS